LVTPLYFSGLASPIGSSTEADQRLADAEGWTTTVDVGEFFDVLRLLLASIRAGFGFRPKTAMLNHRVEGPIESSLNRQHSIPKGDCQRVLGNVFLARRIVVTGKSASRLFQPSGNRLSFLLGFVNWFILRFPAVLLHGRNSQEGTALRGVLLRW